VNGEDVMGVIRDLLCDVPVPKMVRIHQEFDDTKLEDVEAAVREQLNRPEICDKIQPGKTIAITCGSRRIDNMALVIRTISRFCTERGAKPFIFPAMGSHGGALAQGQKEICESYGVTEEYCECPIRSSMEVVSLGTATCGVPAYIDRFASEADGIIVTNRIKAHPGFSGEYESGLVKMMVIGMGKQVGAETCHKYGYGEFPRMLDSIAHKIVEKAPVICGVGLIENAYDQTKEVAVLTPDEIFEQEPALLRKAKNNMPRLLAERCDVLVVDRMGKDISGSGMDSNIIGRVANPFKKVDNFWAERVVTLNLTPESHGSMGGIGKADIINKRIFEDGELELTYPNSITHTYVRADAIPMMLDTDKLAVQCAIKTCACADMKKVEVIRMLDTLHLKHLMVSESLAERIKDMPGITILGEAEEWKFDENETQYDCWNDGGWND